MDTVMKDDFLARWERYFGDAEFPITCAFVSDPEMGKGIKPAAGWRCLIGELARARKGETVAVNGASLGCSGAKRFLGYQRETRPGFEYFLSCGIPGKIDGERHKRGPELVLEWQKAHEHYSAEGRITVF